MNEGYIDKQESNINHRNNIYYPVVIDSENNSIVDDFLDQKTIIDYQTRKVNLTDFTRDLSSEYIKGKVEKVVSWSSTPGLFCEIFDSEDKNITVDELVERYYSVSKNIQKGYVSDDQQTEQEPSLVVQTEAFDSRSIEKIEENDYRLSTYYYSCYYCDDFKTNDETDYERHVLKLHGLGHPCYPCKADLERLGLKAQGKSWEI
jgi:hypothetical protein